MNLQQAIEAKDNLSWVAYHTPDTDGFPTKRRGRIYALTENYAVLISDTGKEDGAPVEDIELFQEGDNGQLY